MIELEARVGRGIGTVLFGWSEAEVQALLGPADKARTVEVVDNKEERRLVYHRLRCSFWFQEDRLHWICCANPDLVLFGSKLVGREKEEVLHLCGQHVSDTLDSEDYLEWESHTLEESWLELQFYYGTLREVCFGHLYGDDDEPVWPVA